MFIRLSSTCSRFHPSLFASPSVSRSRTFFTLGSASGLKLSHPFDDSPPSTSPSVGCCSCGKNFLANDPTWTAKRFARRSVVKDRRIVDFLRAARIRMHGLISPETRSLIARRKEAVFKNVAATREKVRRKIVVVRENIWTLPNIICWMRIAAAPYLGYLIIQEDYRLALYLFVVAGLSDLADGFIARTFKSQRTQFGSFLDPAADKVLVACTFLPLAAVGLVPWYLSSVVIGRDVCLVAAGFYVRYMSLPPPITFSRFFEASRVTAQLKPTYLSKANTGFQLSLIVATLATHSYEFIDPAFLFYLCNITFVTTVASGLDYAIRSRSTYKLLTEKRVAGGSGKTR